MNRAKFLVNDNSTAILTGLGVTGTVATAYLTGRATFKAADIIEKEKRNRKVQKDEEASEEKGHIVLEHPELSNKQKVKLVWQLYIPPTVVGITTIVAIISANRIASKQIAALVVASGISERALQEYRSKIVEKFGASKDQDVRDDIAQERVNNHPLSNREIILAGTGEVLCYDMTTGRYFQSTIEEIKHAENKVNYDLIHFMHASLSDFYDEIGLPATDYTDSVGWNVNNRMEVQYSSVLMNGKPCLAISFKRQPLPDYAKTAWDG